MAQAVGFLKIDIEGAEELLFGPEGGCDEWLPLVTCLSMEVHKQALPQDWEQIVFQAAMQRNGFKFILASCELTVWCNSKRYRRKLPNFDSRCSDLGLFFRTRAAAGQSRLP